ncbi:MAG: T9SS type A sorting domain-containing protein, partial [Cyclobacteriaceae bacterium]|nr:T9SS type A sorting domain-containing protein [Cyclobacteriaceae bacterium]
QGVIAQDVLGVRDITYALLIGIWKVSQYENETHIKWEQAAWALWNSGFFNHYSTHSVCVGLYLIVKNATPFQPLHLREDFILSSDNPVKNEQTFEIYPNLTSDKLILNISDDNHKLKYYVISDIQGRIVSEGNLYASTEINISGLNKGLYLIRVSDYSKRIKSVKFIRN